VNVIKIVMPSVLGFDDGAHYVEKKNKCGLRRR
jgi:hypothetical protein